MDQLKKEIQALLNSCPRNSLTVTQLNKDFYEMEGYNIPYHDYGFKQLDAMLRAMSDVLQVNGYGPSATVIAVKTQKSKHISRMVEVQKSNSKNCRKQLEFAAQGNNNRRSSPMSNCSRPLNNHSYKNFAKRNDILPNDSSNDSNSSFDELCCRERNENCPSNSKKVTFNPGATHSRGTNIPQNFPQDQSFALNKDEYKSKGNQNVKSLAVCHGLAGKPSISTAKHEGIPADAMTPTEVLPERSLPEQATPGSMTKVLVTSVLSPFYLYVQTICQAENLAQLAEDMENVYSGKKFSSDWHLNERIAKVGMYCVTKYHNVWYRAVIADTITDRCVKLLLIDYGYKLNVELGEILYMSKKHAALPPQNSRVSLAHVKPTTPQWSEDASRFLTEAVYNRVLHMFYVSTNSLDGILDVVFIDTNASKDVILNSELVVNKFARWIHA